MALGGEEHRAGRAGDLQVKGAHNASNALAVAAAALALGVDAADVAAHLRSFKPLEHRIEPCGTVAGASCYNDSKATNVDATLTALAAFPEARPIVLLGGDDKGTDLAPLVEAARAHARAAVCFGAARERFAAAFGVDGSAGEDGGDFAVLQASCSGRRPRRGAGHRGCGRRRAAVAGLRVVRRVRLVRGARRARSRRSWPTRSARVEA